MIHCTVCGSPMVMDCHYENEARSEYQCPECGDARWVEDDYTGDE